MLPKEILNLIYQYMFHTCHLCNTLTKSFCRKPFCNDCRKPSCSLHYHFINNGKCDVCVSNLLHQ